MAGSRVDTPSMKKLLPYWPSPRTDGLPSLGPPSLGVDAAVDAGDRVHHVLVAAADRQVLDLVLAEATWRTSSSSWCR